MKPEPFIVELYRNRYGLILEKIPEGEDKTPDFVCSSGSRVLFVTELKTFTRGEVSEKSGYIFNEEGIYYNEREDNSVGRVRTRIEDAVGQLRLYKEPKVVILLNRDGLDYLDLKEAIDGWLSYSNEKKIYVDKRSTYIANALKNHLSQIDLITWIDENERIIYHKYLNERGEDLCRHCFSINNFD